MFSFVCFVCPAALVCFLAFISFFIFPILPDQPQEKISLLEHIVKQSAFLKFAHKFHQEVNVSKLSLHWLAQLSKNPVKGIWGRSLFTSKRFFLVLFSWLNFLLEADILKSYNSKEISSIAVTYLWWGDGLGLASFIGLSLYIWRYFLFFICNHNFWILLLGRKKQEIQNLKSRHWTNSRTSGCDHLS